MHAVGAYAVLHASCIVLHQPIYLYIPLLNQASLPAAAAAGCMLIGG
jgi:hypothetical protein